MERVIDQFGRVVLPKDLLDQLGLRQGDYLSVRRQGEGIFLEKRTEPKEVVGRAKIKTL